MTFVHHLINLNGLDRFGFKRWLFYPGMLFRSRRSWWGAGVPRPFTHEGVDLCFFEAKDGTRFRLDPSIRIPMGEDGEIISIIDDFIGKTIVCEHHAYTRMAKSPIYMLYAHVLPEKGVKPGDALKEGQGLARIAPVDPDKTPLPPHLHLSAVFRDKLPLPHSFDWPYLNRLEREAFIDPLPIAGLTSFDMRIIDFDPSIDISGEYEPCPGNRQIG